MASISLQPFKTMGSLTGLFNTESRGLTQGDAQDDPAVRLQLCSGAIGSAVTTSMWGGLGVLECVPTAESVTGSIIVAPTATQCNAFTVFNQAYHGITTPSSPVPQFLPGGSIHYYRIGSGARIPLPISEDVAALAAASTPSPVGAVGFVWDLTNNWIDLYDETVTTNPRIAVRLLQVSNGGNQMVSKDTDGNLIWDDAPAGLFLI
ncbi:hypothetical protein [Citrobacter werkmanii]|uniref:hypothetical protein n=1 Tax=Citrobacter werkmanii TaxID=67827 RepID=UPI00300CAB0F